MACLERYGSFADAWDLGHIQYVLANALRALYRGQQERVGDLLSLLFVALEQASLDQGSMDLAYLYTLLPDPPAELLAREPLRHAIRQSPKISDQEWTASLLAYLQQMDTIGKRRQEQLQLAKKRTRRPKHGFQEEKPPKAPKTKA